MTMRVRKKNIPNLPTQIHKEDSMISEKKSEIYDLLVSLREALGDSIPKKLETRYNIVMKDYNDVVRNEIDELARDTIHSRYSTDTDIDMNVIIVPKE